MEISSLRPALWDIFKEKYQLSDSIKDSFAGVIVGVIAVPLSIAFAIASGVKPEQGLITAVVAGLLISVFSGSRVQIGGPTGAFIVILYSIVQKYGIDGLAAATVLAGLALIAMALAGLGDIIKYIPWPVTIGFTSGIAVVIFTTQVQHALGLKIPKMPEHFLEQWACLLEHIGQTNFYALGLTVLTILLIVYWPRLTHRIPGTLVAILFCSAIAFWFHMPVETIGSRFGEIKSVLPKPVFPKLSFQDFRQLISPAFAIAMLAGIESLLSAVVADGMIGDRHRSNAELMAQGIANIASSLFGGIPATGAIARTAANIKNGGRTPIAGIVHALTVLLVLLFLGRQAAYIPMSVLAGILIVVAYNMSEYHLFVKMFRAPRADWLVMLTTFSLTVLVDLTVAIEVGVMLAILLFIKRMIAASETTAITSFLSNGAPQKDDPDATSRKEIPAGVEVFEISGPFFFGAAEKFKTALYQLVENPNVLILRMRNVPVMDATGLKTLEEVVDRHHRRNTRIVLSGVQPQILKKLQATGIADKIGMENITPHIDVALERARQILNATPSAADSPSTHQAPQHH